MSAVEEVQNSNGIESVWLTYRESGDLQARNQLLAFYLDRTRALAGKLYKSRLSNIADYADYLHFGVLGLIASIERFDPSYGAQFFTYASHRIKGSIIDGVASMEEKTASPSSALIFKTRIDSINEYQYDNEDLFENMVETSVMLALGIMLENDEPESDQYTNHAYYELQEVLKNYVELLDKNEKIIIQYHYFHQFSFVTIAELLGVGKSRVSQLHKKALEDLREKCSSTLELEL